MDDLTHKLADVFIRFILKFCQLCQLDIELTASAQNGCGGFPIQNGFVIM